MGSGSLVEGQVEQLGGEGRPNLSYHNNDYGTLDPTGWMLNPTNWKISLDASPHHTRGSGSRSHEDFPCWSTLSSQHVKVESSSTHSSRRQTEQCQRSCRMVSVYS